VKLVVGFIIKKLVTMHGNMNVKKTQFSQKMSLVSRMLFD